MTPLRPRGTGDCPRSPGRKGQHPRRRLSRGDTSTCRRPSTGIGGKEARVQHTRHTHTGAHGTLSHRHDSGTERPPSQAPGHSPCPEATGPAGPACHLECHGPRVSPGPAGYCLHFPCRRPAELSSDAQPLKVTVFPGASATLQSFLQSGSQCWLAFRRTFTAFFVYFFGLGIYLMISDSLS